MMQKSNLLLGDKRTCDVVPSLENRGTQRPHWLRYFLIETLTEVDPGPNQTLDPPFSDAEIFPWVLKEHVTCWCYHWTSGGSTEPHYLRYLLHDKLREVVLGPNFQ